jgi:hypothetical protein
VELVNCYRCQTKRRLNDCRAERGRATSLQSCHIFRSKLTVLRQTSHALADSSYDMETYAHIRLKD